MSRRFWKITGAVVGALTGTVAATVYVALEGHTEKFYNRFILPVFHRLDPELSHKLAISILKTFYVPGSYYHDPKELSSYVGLFTFSNPIGLAAGFDKDGEALFALDKFGFGFVEVGSVTPKPQLGNEKPRVFRLPEDKAIINRYGFNSAGHDQVLKYLKVQKLHDFYDCALGVNLGVNKDSESPVDDYVKGIRKFADVADYYVINVSSPNTSGLRDLQKKEHLDTVLTKVIQTRDELKVKSKPLLFLKLSPDLSKEEREDIAAIISIPSCRVDGLIISNTTIQRDPSLKSPLKTESGGLSGLPLKKRSTEMISDMYKLTKGEIPIIGVGGVFTGEDAFEKIKAGATLVQIYTSFIYHGAPIVDKIKKELLECLRREHFSTVTDAIGAGIKE